MGRDVRLYEVSLRDGLQNESVIVPTDVKLELAARLVSAGFTDIEVASFVSPRRVPQMADASEIFRRLPENPDVRYWALIPNTIGMDRALDAGVEHIATFLSASETHNRKNVNRTIRESLAGLRKVIATARAHGVQVRAYISTVFGCPYEGEVDAHQTLDLALALRQAGATEIALGDTTGVADPEQVKHVLRILLDGGVPLDCLAVHFHDTCGVALANAYSAWQVGVRNFDGSISGIGGCPYAPGATGNAATEDLLHMFQRMHCDTGIDLDTACEAGRFMQEVLERVLPGRYQAYWQAKQTRAEATAQSA